MTLPPQVLRALAVGLGLGAGAAMLEPPAGALILAVGAVAAGAAGLLWSARSPEGPSDSAPAGPPTPPPGPVPPDDDVDRIVYLVSHELHEPLRTMATFANLLIEDHGDALGDDGRTQARFVAEGADRMKARLDALLALSRVARGPRTPVDVAGAVADARARLGAELEGARVTVDVAANAGTVVADGEALRELLVHLVRNAVTASPAGAPIEVASRREHGALVLSVRDHGRGHDAETARAAFRPFWSRDPGGERRMGMGLAFCDRIVQRHGGRIAMEAASPGTRISIRLPEGPS